MEWKKLRQFFSKYRKIIFSKTPPFFCLHFSAQFVFIKKKFCSKLKQYLRDINSKLRMLIMNEPWKMDFSSYLLTFISYEHHYVINMYAANRLWNLEIISDYLNQIKSYHVATILTLWRVFFFTFYPHRSQTNIFFNINKSYTGLKKLCFLRKTTLKIKIAITLRNFCFQNGKLRGALFLLKNNIFH